MTRYARGEPVKLRLAVCGPSGGRRPATLRV